MKSKDLRESFVLDFVKIFIVADIPLERTEKVRPFLHKYCQQAGALSIASSYPSNNLRSKDLRGSFFGTFGIFFVTSP